MKRRNFNIELFKSDNYRIPCLYLLTLSFLLLLTPTLTAQIKNPNSTFTLRVFDSGNEIDYTSEDYWILVEDNLKNYLDPFTQNPYFQLTGNKPIYPQPNFYPHLTFRHNDLSIEEYELIIFKKGRKGPMHVALQGLPLAGEFEILVKFKPGRYKIKLKQAKEGKPLKSIIDLRRKTWGFGRFKAPQWSKREWRPFSAHRLFLQLRTPEGAFFHPADSSYSIDVTHHFSQGSWQEHISQSQDGYSQTDLVYWERDDKDSTYAPTRNPGYVDSLCTDWYLEIPNYADTDKIVITLKQPGSSDAEIELKSSPRRYILTGPLVFDKAYQQIDLESLLDKHYSEEEQRQYWRWRLFEVPLE